MSEEKHKDISSSPRFEGSFMALSGPSVGLFWVKKKGIGNDSIEHAKNSKKTDAFPSHDIQKKSPRCEHSCR